MGAMVCGVDTFLPEGADGFCERADMVDCLRERYTAGIRGSRSIVGVGYGAGAGPGGQKGAHGIQRWSGEGKRRAEERVVGRHMLRWIMALTIS